MDEDVTKIEFLLEVLPSLSKQDIITRLQNAPASERSTDALVAFFLAKEEKMNTDLPKENEDINEREESGPNEINNGNDETEVTEAPRVPHRSKHVIQDDLDESFEVSPDPVEYDALTGKIEKTAEQLKQEEDDFTLAQKLYEDELKRESQRINDPYQPTYISPYHKPPPASDPTKRTSPTSRSNTTTTTTSKSNTTTSTSTSKPVQQANKRQATNNAIQKSKDDAADQLREIRMQRESQWRAKGGKEPTLANAQRGGGTGFNTHYYNQIKEVRENQNREWRDSKLSQKRVMTLSDMDKAAKQAHIDSGTWSASDSAAVRVGKEALELTNKFRKENKLPPLAWHDALCKIGTQHSKNMAEHKVPFGHDGFNDRIKQYPMPHRSAAENVAMSRGVSDVAQTAVNGWINSPGHRKNLLSHSEYCGIGCYEGMDGSWYLTQLFAG